MYIIKFITDKDIQGDTQNPKFFEQEIGCGITNIQQEWRGRSVQYRNVVLN